MGFASKCLTTLGKSHFCNFKDAMALSELEISSILRKKVESQIKILHGEPIQVVDESYD